MLTFKLRQGCNFPAFIHAASATVISALVLLFTLAVTPAASAQTFQVIHTFTGGGDGYQPTATLTLDRAGNLYGTTSEGLNGPGTVFQLKRMNGRWVMNTIFTFSLANPAGGLVPYGGVVLGPDGFLYGTTAEGGGGNCESGCGVVYKLLPPVRVCTTINCPWTEVVLYSFTGGADGATPGYGNLTFDQAGNIYGTAAGAGSQDAGVVFKLTRSGQGWTESVLRSFDYADGTTPFSGVIFDTAGNLYGTTPLGGSGGYGTVYQLSPSGSGWMLNTLYSFDPLQGVTEPKGALLLDSSGNLYGTTSLGGNLEGGTVFELSPSGGSWTFNYLWKDSGSDGNLAMDIAGNLYGAANFSTDGFQHGSIFKLAANNGVWTPSRLYNFTGGSDGENPIGGVTLDANGNLYGTTPYGGSQQGENCSASGCGVVWEVTP